MKRIGFFSMAIILLAFPMFSQIIHIPADQHTIQAGIDSAEEGDTVLVSEGTYLENINFRGKAITVASQFLIDGDTSHISNTIIDGREPVHPDTASTVLMISGEGSASVLCGFTITGGAGTLIDGINFVPGESRTRDGGGIMIMDAGCTIENNTIRDNSVGPGIPAFVPNGGGIGIMLSNSERSKNQAIIIQHNIIVNNTLSGDQAGGAGMHIFIENANSAVFSDIIIQNNTISKNSNTHSGINSVAVGSGICMGFHLPVRSGDYIIRNNVISQNRIDHSNPVWVCGGGIYIHYKGEGENLNPSPLIYNNIISDNYSPDKGGGIGVYYWSRPDVNNIGPRPLIFNNTIANNSGESPGLHVTNAKPLLFNNIFWNELRTTASKEFGSRNGKIIAVNNTIQRIGENTEGNIDGDPMFMGGSFELWRGSACVARAKDSIEYGTKWYLAPTVDFSGNPRPNPADKYMDMGAIESVYNK